MWSEVPVTAAKSQSTHRRRAATEPKPMATMSAVKRSMRISHHASIVARSASAPSAATISPARHPRLRRRHRRQWRQYRTRPSGSSSSLSASTASASAAATVASAPPRSPHACAGGTAALFARTRAPAQPLVILPALALLASLTSRLRIV